MIIRPNGGMAASAQGEEPAYVVCTDEGGYGFSLTRFSDETLIELMVEDQTNCPTRELVAELYRDKLVVNLAQDVSEELAIPSDYTISLSESDANMTRIDSALQAIFLGVSRYQKMF